MARGARSPAEEDMQCYRLGYPGQEYSLDAKANFKFYTGVGKQLPNNMFIDQIHREWFGDYQKYATISSNPFCVAGWKIYTGTFSGCFPSARRA